VEEDANIINGGREVLLDVGLPWGRIRLFTIF